MQIIRKHSSTGNLLRVTLRNSSTGQGLTGLDHTSAGLIISTICDNEATPAAYTVAGDTIETIAALGTYAAPMATKCRFKEVDATNHPGLYELQFDNARFSVASAKILVATISGAASLLAKDVVIQLSAVNPDDSVRGGMTALPNAAADGAGGLPISDTGGLDLDTLLGRLDAAITSRHASGAAVAKSPATLAAADVTGNLPADIKAYTVQPTVTGATLHADYDAAMTAAQAGDAMALTAAERQIVSKIIRGRGYTLVEHTGVDADSGAALKVAVEAATAGDMLIVGPGNYSSVATITVPIGVAILGAGGRNKATRIIFTNATHHLKIRSDVSLFDLYVENLTTGALQPYGSPLGGSTNVLIERCYIYGPSDTVSLATLYASSWRFVDCWLEGDYDVLSVVTNGAGNHVKLYNCILNTEGTGVSKKCVRVDYSVNSVQLYNCRLRCVENSGLTNQAQGILLQEGGVCHAFATSIYSLCATGTTYSINVVSGTAVLMDCEFDRTAVNGSLTADIRTLSATQAFELTGNITGDLSGSVGSVTGAVGSVTGAVGSVTGSVGSVAGNVDGSVASVTGAVGSVTGAVGSVTGAVGSVTAGVTLAAATHTGAVIPLVSDVTTKTGYKLASDGLDTVATTAPTGIASNFREMVVQTWRRFFKKSTLTATQLKTYADNGTDVLTTQAASDDTTTQTLGSST